MTKKTFLMIGIVVSTLSSCSQNQYIETPHYGIQHSSPDVISLHEAEIGKLNKEQRSGGFVDWLINGLLGSDPDDSNYSSDNRRNDSSERKRLFVSRNGETLRARLENKKR